MAAVLHHVSPGRRLRRPLVRFAAAAGVRLAPSHATAAEVGYRNNIGGWIYTTAFFFAVSFFSQLITTLPVDYRVTLLINGLLLMNAALARLSSRPRSAHTRDLRARKMALLLFGATSTALAFAVVANIFGGIHLAALLTDAALNNLYRRSFFAPRAKSFMPYAYILTKSGKGEYAAQDRAYRPGLRGGVQPFSTSRSGWHG